MTRESTNGRSSASVVAHERNSDRNGDRNIDRNGDRATRDKSRDSSSSERNLREKEVEKLIYRIRNSDLAVELFSDSLKCLIPGKYLNDEVIQFYISYLIHEKCDTTTMRSSHVFDSYFHKTIRELFSPEKDKQKAEQQKQEIEQEQEPGKEVINRSKWLQLSKWFSGIDIFGKSFLIFPACHDQHWYAIIVCYPLEVRYFDEEPVDPEANGESRKPVPGIIVLDSLGMKNSMVTKEIRCFLDFEWRARFTKVKDFYYHNLKEYKPVLPKQTNSYDCGIFMLAYLRAFLNNPEKFYKLVRRDKSEDQDHLAAMVNMELTACSRESIKSTIHKKCSVEKSRTK